MKTWNWNSSIVKLHRCRDVYITNHSSFTLESSCCSCIYNHIWTYMLDCNICIERRGSGTDLSELMKYLLENSSQTSLHPKVGCLPLVINVIEHPSYTPEYITKVLISQTFGTIRKSNSTIIGAASSAVLKYCLFL